MKLKLKMTTGHMLGLMALSSMGLLSGCFSSGNSLQNGSSGVINGTVMGGLNPIANSAVSLYETASSGPVLLAKTSSSGNGSFQLHYPVPPLGSYLYLVAQGGSTGGAANNPNINLVDVMGQGPNVSSTATINELTTAASYQAFSTDWAATTPVPTLTQGSNSAAGLALSYSTYQGIVNGSNGSFSNYSINTLVGEQLAVQANVLALCVLAVEQKRVKMAKLFGDKKRAHD